MSAANLPARLPLVHGHRGCRGLRPENTLPAFLHAVALGVDVLELDVVISADAQVVVSHEPWPSHLYCTAPNGQPIARTTERAHNFYCLPYATIRAYDCGQRCHPGFPEQQAMPAHKPLLGEVIAAVQALVRQLGRPPVGWSVEVKSTPANDGIFHPAPARFVELVLAVLRASQVLAQATLLSFDERIVQRARLAQPELRLCLLRETPFAAGRVFESLGFVPDVFGPDFQLLSLPLARTLVDSYPGLELVPWTVNEPTDLQRVVTWPVAGITTDYPNRLQALLP